MYEKKKIRQIKLIAIIGIILIVLALVWYISGINKNKYGDELTVANLGSYLNGKPGDKDRLNYIKHDLFRVVNMNSKTPVKNNSINDLLVRDSSFSDTLDDKTGVYTVKFIVDSASLKQSYDVSYQWTKSGEPSDALNEWGTVVKCLPIDALVYGDFSCKDMFSELNKPVDPVLPSLPYQTPNIDVTYDPRTTKTLNVTIRTTAADEKTDAEAAINSYMTEVKDWLKSLKGVNADDYTLKYTVVRASLY